MTKQRFFATIFTFDTDVIHFIKISLKQFFVRIALGFLRSMIWIKNHGTFLRGLFKPLHDVGLFFIRFVGVPLYRSLLLMRRFVGRLTRPTKHRFLSIVTNRFVAHAIVVMIVMIVVSVNINTRRVRAESIGQQSLLYQLVVSDTTQTVDVVQASDRVVTLGGTTRYISDTLADARSYIDPDFLGEPYVTPQDGETTTSRSRVVSTRAGVEQYIVREGDTLGAIADRYGLNLSTILWANQLSFRSTIRPGDTLKIMQKDGVTHTVRSGDTLSSIARKYSIDLNEILLENQLASADRLKIGVDLFIPGGEPLTVSALTPRSTSVKNLFTPPSKNPVVSGWVWPTDWRVITQYFGWKHTGLDIDGDYSTLNYAARDGKVVFSGWKGGYGLSVEVDHGDGYMTRYAHFSKLTISFGDVVNAGQALGVTGTTGRSTGTHLHFEIIKNGKFQNPLDYVR